jgi:uncharacterized RDD family membrane protein YckC
MAPAALWRRLTAVAYDWLLLTAIFFVVTAIVVASHRSAVASGALWFQVLLGACGWLYFAWCWVHGGQTVGMRAWKLRLVVARDPRLPVTWAQATVRYMTALLPAAPLAAAAVGLDARIAGGITMGAYLLAFGLSLLRNDGSCWHDLASGTRLGRCQ